MRSELKLVMNCAAVMLGVCAAVAVIKRADRGGVSDPDQATLPKSPSDSPLDGGTSGVLTPGELKRRAVDLFPITYLTLISIIQAFPLFTAFSAMIRISGAGLSAEVTKVTQALAVILAVVIVTDEYVLLPLIVRWMPTSRDTLIPFCLGITESWLALEIGRPELWWSALAALCAVAALAYAHTLARTKAAMFGDNRKTYRRYHRVIRTQIAICVMMTAISLCAALLNPHGPRPAVLNIALMWLLVLGGIALAALRARDQRKIYRDYPVVPRRLLPPGPARHWRH